jgi:hypothetical protein
VGGDDDVDDQDEMLGCGMNFSSNISIYEQCCS